MLKADTDGIYTLSFLLLPEYSMMAVLSGIEPLRVANRMAGREVFRWQLVTAQGSAVAASNLLALEQQGGMAQVGQCHPNNLFVCASFNAEQYISPDISRWLQQLHKAGSVLGALDTGCYFLAAAGLLRKDEPVTLHWEALPAFAEKYPEQSLSSELFELGQVISCAGGSSMLDLMLHLIQSLLGHETAVQVCEQFIRSGIRGKTDKQRLDVSARLQLHDQRLIKAVLLMEQEMENPVSMVSLAEQVHVSVRQLERLFKQNLGLTPAEYYLELRLGKARQLLDNSDLSVSAIAMICGFSSGSHFSRSFQSRYGVNPSEQRKKKARVNPA